MKKIILFLSILSLLFLPIEVKGQSLNDLLQQKQDLQNSISANSNQIKNLQDMINSLDSQTTVTQKQIDITSQIIDKTNQQITETQGQIDQKQKEFEKKKADLHETVVTFYETDNPSSIEIIAGANNLSDIIDQSQYMQALSDQVDQQAKEIAKVKSDLENTKNDLQKQEADLENQKNDLNDKQRNLKIQADAKNSLLSQANSQQSQLKGELDNVSAAIYAERQKQGGYITGGTGGYPWANADINGVDYWGFFYRQCTSYVAWYWNVIEGKSWYSFRSRNVDRSSNGGDWADLGAYQGYSVSSTPRAGAIASWPAGGLNAYGHVAIVQSVNSNGTINISEYNWVKYSYSERNNVSPNGAKFIF